MPLIIEKIISPSSLSDFHLRPWARTVLCLATKEKGKHASVTLDFQCEAGKEGRAGCAPRCRPCNRQGR